MVEFGLARRAEVSGGYTLRHLDSEIVVRTPDGEAGAEPLLVREERVVGPEQHAVIQFVVIAAAMDDGEPEVWGLGRVWTEAAYTRMIRRFRQLYDQADVVTGHYIRRFDLPILNGCMLECWMHGSAFDLRTGQPTSPPAVRPVATYHVSVVGEGAYAIINISPKEAA